MIDFNHVLDALNFVTQDSENYVGGVKLYILGILVNIFEFFIPCFVCGTLLGKWDVFPMAGGFPAFPLLP